MKESNGNRIGQGKTVLITGASNGFGMEFAKVFAKNGFNLVLVARSERRLKELGYGLQDEHQLEKVCIVTADLTRSAAPYEIYEELQAAGVQVDVLVNNAGVGLHGFFHETDLNRELDIIQLNITSLVTLTKLFLQDMVARNEGKILNLGSMLSLMPSPLMAIYGASKAFILSFSEALANEVKDKNITVTALCPGSSNTYFFKRAQAENTRAATGPLSEPAEVAKAGYEALMKGEVKVVAGFMNKVQATTANITPDTALASTVRYEMEEEKQISDSL